VRRGGLDIGYLPQQAVSGSDRTLWDEAASGMVALARLRAEVDRAQRAVERGGSVEHFDEVSERFRLAGGWASEERIGEVLHGLGFRSEDWHRPCATFSGGWQMRIALARLLLSDAELLLLDEPTNHLDILARTWLARFLETARRTVVVVSHDRHLLDRVTRRTVEIRSGRLFLFSGAFSAWEREREARFQQLTRAHAEQQKEIHRLERFVNRFRAKASKAAQVRSRAKVLEKMDRIEVIEEERAPRFALPEAPPCAETTLELRDATLGWADVAVVEGVELALSRGTRLALVGPNGCGKSTLLHALAGRLAPMAGRRLVGDGVRLGLFTQDLAQELPAAEPALEVLATLAPEVATAKAWAALGALGLGGEAATLPVGQLSGGEKARVALAGFVIRRHNVLLLDEPTNHLDAVTVGVLVGALRDFEGTLVVASHDRYLVEQVATHVLRFDGDGLHLREGIRPADFEIQPLAAPRRAGGDDGAEAWATRKRRARERERTVRRIAAIEEELPALEQRLAELDEAMIRHSEDYRRVVELAAERDRVQREVDGLFGEWEELEERLGGGQ